MNTTIENIVNLGIHPIRSKYIFGKLEDGRLVSLKSSVPNKLDDIVKTAVAMSNANGGIIMLGVGKSKQLANFGRHENIYIQLKALTTIAGLHGDIDGDLEKIELAFSLLTINISYKIRSIESEKRVIILIDIERASSTAFLCRRNTKTPERQTAYYLGKDAKGSLEFHKTEMRYSAIYKYMTLEAFLLSLYSGQLRFCEPSKWDDKYEQRFYCADYTNLLTSNSNTPQLFASCFTRKKSNEAAWKVYAHGQGLSCHCVQLKLDIVELRKQIRSSKDIQFFEEKNITYINEKNILEIHKKNSNYYQQYFGSFSRNKFLELLSLKRDAYSYEQEIRLFIIPKNSGGNRNNHRYAKSSDINLNWSQIIKEVRFDKNCSEAERLSLISACLYAGINPQLEPETKISIVPQNVKATNIKFKEFDIDDMPGAKRITIQ